MDWSSDDPTVNYGDSLYVPPPNSDEGVYILDEADRLVNPDRSLPYSRYNAPSAGGGLAAWAHHNPNTGRRSGREGFAPSHRTIQQDVGMEHHRGRGQHHEGYYTGGNVRPLTAGASDNTQRIFNVAWDERPQQYNPHTGGEWAKLLPSPEHRPYNGSPPTASLAYPILSTSEAQDRLSGGSNWPSAPTMGCSNGTVRETLAASPSGGKQKNHMLAIPLDYLAVILLIVIVILLGMLLAAAGRIERKLGYLLQEAILAGRSGAAS